MIVRTLARWMFASWFVREGMSAMRAPAPHVVLARPLLGRLAANNPPSAAKLTKIVRLQGLVMAGAGGALALGIAPRLAALTLAATTLPTAIANAPHLSGGAKPGSASPDTAAGLPDLGRDAYDLDSYDLEPYDIDPPRAGAPVPHGTAAHTAGPANNAERKRRFATAVALSGAALLAAFDREGRPSLAWRMSHARPKKVTT